MSDDLISRKALMKQFIVSDNGRRIPEYDIDNFPITISVKDVKDIIRKAPIAFDKEKVIEDLTDWKNDAERWAAKYDEVGDTDNMDLQDMAVRCYVNAIEIVKKGGIE